MSHRTYRHVDTPVPYMGLTWRQWLLIVCCAALAIGIVDLLHPPTPIALWLATVLMAGPVTVSYFTTGATVRVTTQLLDVTRWLIEARELPAPTTVERVQARGFMVANGERLPTRPSVKRARPSASSSDVVGLEALASDGVGVCSSGAFVRWLEVTPINPLIHDSDSAEIIAKGFEQVMARLPDDRQHLQLLAHATPVALDAVLNAERSVTDAAVAKARFEGRGDLAVALERLGLARGAVNTDTCSGARSDGASLLRRLSVDATKKCNSHAPLPSG